ncbi:tail fiber protein [Sphingomonas sp. LB-2]|uniref:phage tail protein n=1 Tax=Sphingomonas caeni TaxID=2984949 RepID=UPI00222EB68C|nr:tail fiber protein [Sphingomonas caeni]MCW3849576.1 tail fiber protein [Sphingomonas caeni]
MSNPFLGEIRIFAGNFNPRGWAYCAGQLLPISQNDALYALLGTTFGGDGQVTFGLPDLRGRVVIGQGTGPGLSGYVVGQMAGTESVTLLTTQMPAHNHTMQAYNIDATAATPGPGLAPANPLDAISGQSSLFYLNTDVINPPPNQPVLAADTIQPAGGNQPHNNQAPSLVLNYIIALEGVFPSRN